MPFDGKGHETAFDALAKMDKVLALLAREDQWCKQHLRAPDNRRCILGALAEADGVEALREPILQAIAQVTGIPFARIEVFNDHCSTTHDEVVAVLRVAREIIILGRLTDPACSKRASHRGGAWSRPTAWLRSLFRLRQLPSA